MFNTAEPPSTHLVFVCCPRGPRKLFNMEDIKTLAVADSDREGGREHASTQCWTYRQLHKHGENYQRNFNYTVTGNLYLEVFVD